MAKIMNATVTTLPHGSPYGKAGTPCVILQGGRLVVGKSKEGAILAASELALSEGWKGVQFEEK